MRVSLYKHELEVVERLAVAFVRLRQNECSQLAIENVGPEIFGKLLDEMYSRGNYQHTPYTNFQPIEIDTSEVPDRPVDPQNPQE